MDSTQDATENTVLRNEVQPILDLLPSRDFTQPVTREVEFYGAARIIAETLDLKKPPPSYGSWSHGFHKEEVLSIFIAHEKRTSETTLVRCERHAEILRKAGFPYAMAVGMPYLYALKHPRSVPPRIPGSLLIMPGHTLTNLKTPPGEDAYIQEILEIRDHFSTIVACLHKDCVINGYWTEKLEKAGINWVIGAGNTDTNSLRRIHSLFSTFEFMTTNGFGSHIQYAAATGCRVSIFGELQDLCHREILEQNPFYKSHPEAVEFSLKNYNLNRLREEFSQFFVSPQNAENFTEWGLQEIGAPFYRSPVEIARLLGWAWTQEEPAYQDKTFAEMAPLLGCDRSAENNRQSENEICELSGRVAWLQDQRAEAKLRLNEAMKENRKLETQLEKGSKEYQKIRRSISWKIIRPLHSIEKRLKKLFQK